MKSYTKFPVSLFHFSNYASRVADYTKTNIFTKFSMLAVQNQAVNLGQGFPDYKPPQFLRDNISNAIQNDQFQVSSSAGSDRLLTSIQRFLQPKVQYELRNKNQFLISHGATTSLTAAIFTFVGPQDEVVIIDPSFDIYRPIVEFAGGVHRSVQIRPRSNLNNRQKMKERGPEPQFEQDLDDWELDWEQLEKVLSKKTRLLILNTPQNPVGKIFSEEEIERLALVLEKYPQVTVISDEAYSHISFAPYTTFGHPRAIENNKLRNKTVTIMSIGKIFSSSGLRLGVAFGNQDLIEPMTLANNALVSYINTPLQVGAADSFDDCLATNYFERKAHDYQQKSQFLQQALLETGLDLTYWVPQGGYFIVSDVSKVTVPEKYYYSEGEGTRLGKDSAFVYWFANEWKVVGIPLQSFFPRDTRHENQNYVRWAFCKDDLTLKRAKENFQKYR